MMSLITKEEAERILADAGVHVRRASYTQEVIATLLKDVGRPMTIRELVEICFVKQLLTSSNGKEGLTALIKSGASRGRESGLFEHDSKTHTIKLRNRKQP